MKFNWNKYQNYNVSLILVENFGCVINEKLETPFYEVSYKVGVLSGVFEDGVELTSKIENRTIISFVPYNMIKCTDFISPENN